MAVLRKIWPCRTGVYMSKDFVDARQENLVNLRVLDFTWKESTSVTTEYILQTLFRAFTKKQWLWQGNRGMFHLLERLQEIALQSFIPRNLKANCGSQRFLVFDNRYWPTIKTRDVTLFLRNFQRVKCENRSSWLTVWHFHTQNPINSKLTRIVWKRVSKENSRSLCFFPQSPSASTLKFSSFSCFYL